MFEAENGCFLHLCTNLCISASVHKFSLNVPQEGSQQDLLAPCTAVSNGGKPHSTSRTVLWELGTQLLSQISAFFIFWGSWPHFQHG